MRMEHRFIDSLFQRVRATDDDQPQLLADLAHNIVRALARHLFCEEYALYAVDGGVLLRAGWSNGAMVADEMAKEHFVLKGALYRLQDTTPQDDCLRQCVFWLHARYKQHADREETEVRCDTARSLTSLHLPPHARRDATSVHQLLATYSSHPRLRVLLHRYWTCSAAA